LAAGPALAGWAVLGVLFTSCAIVADEPRSFSIDTARPGFVVPQDALLLFYVDGVHVPVMEEMLARGELPNLKRFFVDGGVSVRHAITSVPSVTFANAASMVTGVYPGEHQAWANKWFDRNLLFTRNYEQGRGAIDTDMEGPTIFELCPDKVSGIVGAAVQRGVKLPVGVSVKTGGVPSQRQPSASATANSTV
jgi:hypothetical protein